LISDCQGGVLPSQYITITNDNLATFKIKKPHCESGFPCISNIQIYASQFLSKQEAYDLWDREKANLSDEAHMLFNNENSIYLYDKNRYISESRYANQNPSGFCINKKEISVAPGKSAGGNISPEFFIGSNLSLVLKINWQKQNYCYQFSGGYGDTDTNTCLSFKDPNSVE